MQVCAYYGHEIQDYKARHYTNAVIIIIIITFWVLNNSPAYLIKPSLVNLAS